MADEVRADRRRTGEAAARRVPVKLLFPLVACVLPAFALLTVGLVITDARHAAVKLIGKWLIGITVAHLIVLWIVPVVILPAVTTNPWAHLVAAVARAVGAGIVTSLVVLALVGVVFLFVDHFIPARATAPVGSD